MSSNHTPDHWHIIPAIMAAKCGKDVICEKPLTLFHAEGVALCKAVAEHKRVFQTASENRSIDVYIRLAELVRSGVLGKLQSIEVGLPTGNNDIRLGPQSKSTFNQRQPQPVPPELDYDMWLGQAPRLPYIPARLHGAFRWNLAFSGGVICDWGAHMIDLAQWGHDTEHTGPVTRRRHRRLSAPRRGVQHRAHIRPRIRVRRRREAESEERRPLHPLPRLEWLALLSRLARCPSGQRPGHPSDEG